MDEIQVMNRDNSSFRPICRADFMDPTDLLLKINSLSNYLVIDVRSKKDYNKWKIDCECVNVPPDEIDKEMASILVDRLYDTEIDMYEYSLLVNWDKCDLVILIDWDSTWQKYSRSIAALWETLMRQPPQNDKSVVLPRIMILEGGLSQFINLFPYNVQRLNNNKAVDNHDPPSPHAIRSKRFKAWNSMEPRVLERIYQMQVGERFESLEIWNSFLGLYEQEQGQKFWVRDSKKIGSVDVKRKINDDIVYYKLWVHCIHGGMKFKSRSKGERQSSTHKMDCPACIKLLASSDGKALEIKSLCLQHENHDLSQSAFDHLPQNRKLAKIEKEEAQELLKLGCNKKLLQNKIAMDTGKRATLKDLTNIKSSLKRNDGNDLVKAVTLLETKYHASVSVLRDEDNRFKGLYLSTQDMRDSMGAWPEIVLVDGTYTLLAQGFTLMLNLVEDSHGLSEVVAACLMVNEDRATFKWFLEHFKNENLDACKKINCFMADKDLLERDVLSEVFSVPVYICLFHTLKTFSRQITTEKMKISAQQREEILRILQDLTYSSSEAVYEEKYATLSEVAPERVLDYFNKNWHPIRKEWTVYNMVHSNLKNITNNRLESINNKIKQVVPKNSTLVSFIEYFFEWLSSHKFERNHKAAQHVLKRPVTTYSTDSAESQYLAYLTGHAYRYVLNEMQKSSFIRANAITKDDVTGNYSIRSKDVILLVTPASCKCGDWTSMMLPCQHIFAVRRLEQLVLFDEDLCDTRWTREYYLERQRTFRSHNNAQSLRETTPTPVVVTTKKQRSLTLTEKRKRASSVNSSLVTLASLASRDLFLYKLNTLKTIEEFWREGYEVSVERIDISSSRSTPVSLVNASEKSDCEEGCTSETCSDVDIQEDQIFEDNVQNNCASRASNCGSISTTSIVEAIPGSSKECFLSEPRDFNINTASLPIIEEEEFRELGSSFTENDSALFAKILDVDQPFDLLNFLEATASSRLENLTEPVTTTENMMSGENMTSFDEAKMIDVPCPNPGCSDGNLPSTSEDVLEDDSGSREGLKEIVMPASVRVRGRPRGAGLTVIGTKVKKPTVQKKGPIAYKKRSEKEKVRLVLGWCVSEHIIPDVLRGKFLVQECDVEMRPEKIDSAILDENVDLNMIKKYVNDEAFVFRVYGKD